MSLVRTSLQLGSGAAAVLLSYWACSSVLVSKQQRQGMATGGPENEHILSVIGENKELNVATKEVSEFTPSVVSS